MEIFLLFVVILLLVIFHSVKNSKLKTLERKLSHIEKYLQSISFQQSQETVQAAEKVAEKSQQTVTPSVVAPPVTNKPVVNDVQPPPVKEVEKVIEPVPVTNIQPVEPIVQAQTAQQMVVKAPVTPKAGWYDTFRKNNPDLEKFIGENILSKVAITVLVIGIAFFVKFAIDKEWINEIARVGIGVLCGGIVLGFAHRLHKQFKAFSSVLVAGGIAIFYFTIGIAFHQYHLFNQTTAFIIMLLITGFSVFISILYDRVELAALSIIGGFATPFMVSTGQGNYVALFVYVLILDAGMLVLAYLRKWNLINILAYCFTMLLYFSWLQTKVIGEENAPYKGAFLFASVFYVVFVLMNIINNIKEKRKFGALELSILISNTFLFYGAGMQILSNYHPELQGIFSISMALFNLVCSWFLYKKFKADEKLVYLMIGLTLTFITLTAPVQLHGNYITIFWALEAVLLIWLAQKSGIVLYRFASIIITLLMGISLIMDWVNVYTGYHEFPLIIIVNKAFITAFVASASLLAVVILLRKESDSVKYLGIPFNPKTYRTLLSIGFVVLFYLTGLFELVYQLNERIYYGSSIAIVIGSYHLLYFSLLNIAANKINANGALVTMYVLNFINAVIFVLFFAIIPIVDFKESLFDGYTNHIGFLFHYVSIACFIFIIRQMHLAISRPGSTIVYSKVLNSVLLTLAIIYMSSSELILHVFKVTLPSQFANISDDYSVKSVLYGLTETHIIKIGFPILWGVLAFLFLFIGMKKFNKPFRVIALILIGITLLKLFTYDIKDASEAGKIIAFIILGVVLLIISFMYQKIKALLLDDEKKLEATINPEETV
ncbi:MAG: hypothetical protein K0S53_2806 [Bacteroidetes bacterium]|jgi:uncharacterized membrane protein|nr:hypothetical protein [Bacteroidota bacterium]